MRELESTQFQQAILSKDSFSIGVWMVEPSANRLISENGKEYILRPKVMKVLQLLAASDGKVVSREDFIDHVWKGNDYVGKRGITDAIWQLRKLLDEDPQNAPYIDTIARTGYRLLVLGEWFAKEVRSKTNHTVSLPIISNFKWVVSTIALLIISIVLYFNQGDVPSPRLITQEQVYMLNHEPGSQTVAKFSRDGRFITYIRGHDGQFDLRLQEITNVNAEPVTLLSHNLHLAFPTFSPDGNKIAFGMLDSPTECAIKVISLITRKIEKIKVCSINWLRGLDWSFDGSMLAFSGVASKTETTGIMIYNLAAKTTRQITSLEQSKFHADSYPLWAENDNSIYFLRSENINNSNIYSISLAGELNQLTSVKYNINGFTYGDTSDSLFFSGEQSDIRSIYKLDIHDKAIDKLFIVEKDAIYPIYSRTTKNLAFIKSSLLKQIYELALNDDKNVVSEKLHLASLGNERALSFNSIFESTAFVSNFSGTNNLWIKNKGGMLASASQKKIQIYGTAWSPDGTKVAYNASSATDKYFQIFVYDTKSYKTKQITFNSAEHAQPTWSHDGKHVLCSELKNGDFYLWRYSLNGKREKVADEPFIYALAHGNKLIASKMKEGGLWLYDKNSKFSEKIIDDLEFGDGNSFAITQKGIFYLSRTTKNDIIKFYYFDTKQSQQVTKYSVRNIPLTQSIAFDQKTNRLLIVKSPPLNNRIFYTHYSLK